MAARPQGKVASCAADCNYGPAEDPAQPHTLLEWVSSNLHPFETIALRSASRGHDTEEWKYKKHTQKNKKKTLSSVNYSILSHNQHLSFTVNRAWNTWAGIGGAKSASGQAGSGEGEEGGGGCCWQVRWKSDDKYSQSDSYFGFCQFSGAEQTLSSLLHCVLMRTCLLNPSLHRSCDHSILLLWDVSQELHQNSLITISTQFFLFLV